MPTSDAFVELAGQRVVLRTFVTADLTDQYISWLNDPQTMRWSNQRFRHHDRASCELFLAHFAQGPSHFLSIRESMTGFALGTATAYVSLPHGTADAGILLGERSFWGLGYGQDAWNTLLEWLSAQPKIRKITAGTLACNKPMVRLIEKSGMQLEGTRRSQEIVEGNEEDILLYARFRRDTA